MIKIVRSAFTLSEVLITLVVIGVVAMIVIPGIVNNYQEKSWDVGSKVFERHINEAVRLFNIENFNKSFDTTEEFMNAFSRYLKMGKICENNAIEECFGETFSSTDKNYSTSKYSESADFGLLGWDTETIGFVLNNSITGLVAYNPGCMFNDIVDKTSECLGFLYDVNGAKRPNVVGKDIKTYGKIDLNVPALPTFCGTYSWDNNTYTTFSGSYNGSTKHNCSWTSDVTFECTGFSANNSTGTPVCSDGAGHGIPS